MKKRFKKVIEYENLFSLYMILVSLFFAITNALLAKDLQLPASVVIFIGYMTFTFWMLRNDLPKIKVYYEEV